MARTMTGEQLAAHARAQISAADQILAYHHPAAAGLCSCGRQLPCTVSATCAHRREHFTGALALAEQTQLLPVVAR